MLEVGLPSCEDSSFLDVSFKVRGDLDPFEEEALRTRCIVMPVRAAFEMQAALELPMAMFLPTEIPMFFVVLV